MEGVRFGVIEGEVANEASYAITKTLTPSPVIKQIFEANIRTPESRDIVAIKDRSIDLYSVDRNSLSLLSSLPINGFIRGAAPYLRPRRGHENIYTTLFPDSNPTHALEANIPDLVFLFVDTGHLLVIDWQDDLVPDPQSGIQGVKAGLRIATCRKQARPGKELMNIGRFIRVSQDGKWLAIGAWQEIVKLCRLEIRKIDNSAMEMDISQSSKNLLLWHVLWQNNDIELVVTEMRMFYFEGMIWQFEFLKPKHENGARFLIQTTDERGQPKLILCDRATSTNVNINNIRLIAALPLPSTCECPLHMVPLNNEDVCLIYETEIIVLDTQDMAVGGHNPFHFRSSLSFLDGAIVTAAVAYPYTLTGFLKEDSLGSVLLAASKGQAYVIDLDACSEEETLRVWKGFRTNPVSSALCYSDREPKGGFLIIGEMCDTIVYWLPEFGHDLKHLHSIPNWAPIADIQLLRELIREEEELVSKSVDPLALAFPDEGRHRLYVGSGHGEEGSLKELRTGYKTHATVEFELQHVQTIWCLTAPNTAQNMEGFIVTSMTYNETKLLHWDSPTSRKSGEIWSGYLELDDLTETKAIMTSEPTLACSLFRDSMVQITPKGVYLNGIAAKEVNTYERIVHADILEQNLALIIYHQTGNCTLVHLRLVEESSLETTIGLPELQETQLPREASTLKLVKYGEKNLTLCFLAFRFPREIVVYSLEADVAPTSIGHLPIDDPLSQEHPDNPEALEVHSIHLLVVSKITFLLLGMRYGHLLSARFEYDATVGTSFTDQQSTRVGHKQVAFMSSSQEKVEAPFVFLSSDSLWEVSFKDGKLQINEILFDYYRTPNISSGSLSTRDRELVLLMDGMIRFVDVSTQVGVWPRTIFIGQVLH